MIINDNDNWWPERKWWLPIHHALVAAQALAISETFASPRMPYRCCTAVRRWEFSVRWGNHAKRSNPWFIRNMIYIVVTYSLEEGIQKYGHPVLFLVVSYMGCHPSHWLSYFSRWLKPPTSFTFTFYFLHFWLRSWLLVIFHLWDDDQRLGWPLKASVGIL